MAEIRPIKKHEQEAKTQRIADLLSAPTKQGCKRLNEA